MPEVRCTVHWGFVTSHSSDFPPSSDLSDDTSSETSSPPNAYAFDDPELASSSSGAFNGDADGDAAGWPSDGIDGELELGEFVPGVYAALYAFEPELETEMRLEAGEMVSVFERQCAGWVCLPSLPLLPLPPSCLARSRQTVTAY